MATRAEGSSKNGKSTAAAQCEREVPFRGHGSEVNRMSLSIGSQRFHGKSVFERAPRLKVNICQYTTPPSRYPFRQSPKLWPRALGRIRMVAKNRRDKIQLIASAARGKEKDTLRAFFAIEVNKSNWSRTRQDTLTNGW